jgi:hypothetical protein
MLLTLLLPETSGSGGDAARSMRDQVCNDLCSDLIGAGGDDCNSAEKAGNAPTEATVGKWCASVAAAAKCGAEFETIIRDGARGWTLVDGLDSESSCLEGCIISSVAGLERFAAASDRAV